jgi:hypothetical protein
LFLYFKCCEDSDECLCDLHAFPKNDSLNKSNGIVVVLLCLSHSSNLLQENKA